VARHGARQAAKRSPRAALAARRRAGSEPGRGSPAQPAGERPRTGLAFDRQIGARGSERVSTRHPPHPRL